MPISNKTARRAYSHWMTVGPDHPLPRRAASARCRAFSLIELIVVIGIIAVLMSFLLPALRVANESARTVRCASQLRQMGQAIFAYAASNRGLTPPGGGAFRIDDSDSPL